MSASVRSGSVSANSRRHSSFSRETRCPSAPVCHTLRSHTQSNPRAAMRSSWLSGMSSSVAARPSVRDSSVSRTRVLIWYSSGCAASPMSAPAPGAGARGRAGLRRLHLQGARVLAELEELLAGAGREQVHAARDDAGPAGLVARAEAGAVVAVEVLVEQEEIPPMRVLLELPAATEHRAPAGLVPEEDARQPPRDLLGH